MTLLPAVDAEPLLRTPVLSPEQQALLEAAEVEHYHDRLLFLANVWLDKADTFEALHSLFSGERGRQTAPGHHIVTIRGRISALATLGDLFGIDGTSMFCP